MNIYKNTAPVTCEYIRLQATKVRLVASSTLCLKFYHMPSSHDGTRLGGTGLHGVLGWTAQPPATQCSPFTGLCWS